MDETFKTLMEILIEELALREDEVILTATLENDLGMDSLDAELIGFNIEDAYDIEVDTADILECKTVQDLLNLINRRINT